MLNDWRGRRIEVDTLPARVVAAGHSIHRDSELRGAGDVVCFWIIDFATVGKRRLRQRIPNTRLGIMERRLSHPNRFG